MKKYEKIFMLMVAGFITVLFLLKFLFYIDKTNGLGFIMVSPLVLRLSFSLAAKRITTTINTYNPIRPALTGGVGGFNTPLRFHGCCGVVVDSL